MTQNKKWKEKTTILLLILLIIPSVSALTLNVPETITAEQNEQINFEIKIQNNASKPTINATKGTITEQTGKYTYELLVNYEGKTYKEITFTAKDNKTQTTKKTTIAKPPTITGLQDTTINKETLEFVMQTNIESTCKYDTENKEYKDLRYTAKTQQRLEHEAETPKLTRGTHTIHVICKTEKGAQKKETFKINVKLPPTAQIRLNPSSPLRSGIIEVQLTTSHDLISAPELKYFFDDDASHRTVTLTGSGNRWTGHIVIRETERRRVGTFLFKGKDTANLEGTEITSGKTFIVDNHQPKTVSSFEAEIKQDRIKLEWRYLDEEADNIKEYRIYRRQKTGGVEYTDYYATTTQNYYYDRDVEFEEAYYYKISAVNEAGREGPLSKEIALTFMPEREEKPEEKELSPELRTELREKINEANKVLLDIEVIENKMKTKTGDASKIIQDLGILSNIITAKNKIQNKIQELQEIEHKTLTPTQFDAETNKLLQDAKQILNEVPRDIEIKDKLSYEEENNPDKTKETINAYLQSENIEPINKEEFKTNIMNQQENYAVNVEVIKAKIIYEDKEQEITHITKKISVQNQTENKIILENTNTQFFDDIRFLDRPQRTFNKINKWELNTNNKEIRYYANKDLSTEEIKQTQTTIIKQQKIEEQKNAMTALATSPKQDDTNRQLLIPIIIGIISVLFLTVYYFKEEDATILEMFSLRNILPRIKQKKYEHKKLNLDEPINKEELKNIINTKQEEINQEITNEEVKEEINAEQEPSQEIIHKKTIKTEEEQEPEEEKEELYEAIHDIKNMMQDLMEDDFDDFEYLKKLKQIKKKYTKNAPQGKEFILVSGEKIRNINELRKKLKEMNKETFNYHVNQEKNDFYNWIKDVYKYQGIARRIKRARTKKELQRKLKP